MKSYVFALAALAAIGFSGAAFAGDAATAPKAMSDSEMDKVTAGVGTAEGVATARTTSGPAFPDFPKGNSNSPFVSTLGRGVCTTGQSGRCF